MLPQFGFTEFMLVAVIALIVVGPKDLPMMMRKLGQFMAKGKAMAREFQSAFDDIARQAELDELRKEIEDIRRQNALTEAVDELKKAESDINRRVMMEHPMPETGPKGGPGEVAPETDGESKQPSVGQKASSAAAERIGPDGVPAPAESTPQEETIADKAAETPKAQSS